jgi:hypothetical protein
LSSGSTRCEVELNGVEVQQGYAEFLGRSDRDLFGVRDALRDQVRHQVTVAFLGRHHGLGHGRFVDQPILNQALRQSLQHQALCDRRDVLSH